MREKQFITDRNFWAIDLYLGIIALDIFNHQMKTYSEEYRRKHGRLQNMINIRERIRKEATIL